MHSSSEPNSEETDSAQSLGFVIRRIRENRGMLSKFVAHSARIDPATYCRIESGRHTPSPAQVQGIARALDTNAANIARHWAKMLERAEKSEDKKSIGSAVEAPK